MKAILFRLFPFWWIPSFILWVWIGAYIFEYRFPKGWQREWYGLPTMFTYAAIGGSLFSFGWWQATTSKGKSP